MREREIALVGYRSLEERVRSDRDRFSRQLKIGQNDRGNVGRALDLIRVECDAAAEPAEEHLSCGALEACVPPAQVVAGKTVSLRIVLECFHSGMEPGQTSGSANPKRA